MKNFGKGLFTGVLVTSLLAFSFASLGSSSLQTIQAALNSVNVSVNNSKVGSIGENYTLDNGEQVPYSILYKGTTYLPIRKVAETLGKQVTWDGNTRTAGIGEISKETQSQVNYDTNSTMGYAIAEGMDIVDIRSGSEATLGTIKINVKDFYETPYIESRYSDTHYASTGAKFLVLNVDVTNILSYSFDLNPTGMIILDDQNREFPDYEDAIGNIDNYMNFRSLSPGIKENGAIVYEVPVDSKDYYLLIAKAGTNELFKIHLVR